MATTRNRPRIAVRALAIALLLFALGTTTGAVAADPTPEPPSANPNKDVDGVDVGLSETQRRSSSGGPASYTKAGPWTQAVYMARCDDMLCYAGHPVASGTGVNDYSWELRTDCPPHPCTPGVESMPGYPASDPDGEGLAYDVWTRQIDAAGNATSDFKFAGHQCVSAAEAARGGRPVITVDMVMDAAEALAPTPTFTMEPAAGSFVNIPNNYATTAQTVTVTVTVLGSPIPVEFTPTATTWAFGDSTTGTGVGIAGATVGQSGAVEHAYRHSGDYTITVATTYRARVRFPNGQVTTIDTPIVRTSAPQTLHVGEIQTIITDIG